MVQRPPAAESGEDASLDAAAKRLERALALLDSRVRELSDKAGASAGGLFDFDRSKLAAELDASRAREKELSEAGAQASEALGRAIEQIKSALERTETD